jgi:hypothetical protein
VGLFVGWQDRAEVVRHLILLDVICWSLSGCENVVRISLDFFDIVVVVVVGACITLENVESESRVNYLSRLGPLGGTFDWLEKIL